MAKQTVDESLPLDVLAFARQGYLARDARGRCSWKRAGKAVGTIFFHAHHGAVDLAYDLVSRDGGDALHRAYPIPIERTPAPFGGEQAWFLCPSCHARARKLYLPPGRTYFLCRTCHDLSYTSRQKRTSPLSKALAKIDTLTTTLKESRIDSRRWRRIYIETEETVRVFRETDFLAHLRRPLEPRGLDKPGVELAPVRRGRGRPKKKRPYVRRAPFAQGARQTDQQSLCLRCRDFREMQDPQPAVLPNGRPAFKGRCPMCGAGMCLIIKREATAELPPA